MSNLVIVESPAKAKNIKNYLGKGYEVVASMGHVRDLPAARLSVDIKNDFAPKYAVIKGKEKFVKELKEKADKSDKVFLATDPDREGEAISWHLAALLNLDITQHNRVTFNEITKSGVKSGMEKPRAIDIDFVNAQQARRILDRLIGYKLSPFISQKIRRGLSAGRVQSVALRLIVDREEEIRAFNPEEYWSIDGKFTNPPSRKNFSAAFYGNADGKIKLTSKEETDKVLSEIEGKAFVVKSVKKGTRKKSPAPPFITSTLQQEASRRLGFQAKRTMKAAQELYEGLNVAGIGTAGLITYMRTDSLRISDEARAAGNAYITGKYGKDYLPEKPRFFKSRSNSQDGHEAIRPTMPDVTPAQIKDSLSNDQFKIYKLVWERFIASLMENCIQNTVKIDIEVNGYLFAASGYTVKFDGFTALYEESTENVNDSEESGVSLPEIKAGDVLKLKSIDGNQHFTQPPARFTEASLTKALEENGVGRPSTYVTITSTILGREYVVRDGKQFKPTELGEAVTNLLKDKLPKIVNVKFTAQMESDLDEIDDGKRNYIDMIRLYYNDFEEPLEKAKAEMQGIKIKLKEEETDVVCEKCGKNMIIKVGRYGKFLACPGYPDCKNTKPLVYKTNASCPRCGGTVIQKKSKKGHTFYGCDNYPDCKFMTWDEPTDEKCPQCGKSLFKKHGGIIACLDDDCGFSKKIERKKKQEEK